MKEGMLWGGLIFPIEKDLSVRVEYFTEAVFLNVYGAQESIPRNEFRQPM
jgi:hypothetical protein